MDKKTEALKLALEALEHDTEPEPKYGVRTAIDILREELAEQPASKPWVGLTDEEVMRVSTVREAETLLREKNT